MRRADYLALFERIRRTGSDSRLHWLTGARAGCSDPWDGLAASLPGASSRRYGAACREIEAGSCYAETLVGPPRLLVLGAGHVGAAVAALAPSIGFHVTVVDARPEFADGDRLPGADEVLCGPYDEVLGALPPYGNSYVVIVAPGHALDRECAAICLRRPFAYLGMIGSAGKVARVRAILQDQGFTAAELDAMRAPIGLPLGGREPGEIAVAICAEMIQVRHQRGGTVVEPAVQSGMEVLAAAPSRRAALATIVGHAGSVPRGTGSRMLVGVDGVLAGSVGGGAVEAAVAARARELAHTPGAVEVLDHDLSDREGADLGMICGGRVRALIEAL